YVDVGDVARGEGEIRLKLRAVDNERAGEPKLGEILPQRAGLRVLHARLIEDDDAAVPCLGRQGVLEGERANLLRQTSRVAARRRSERAATPAEEIDRGGAMARRAGTLLPVHFFASAVDLAAVLDVMRAALAFGELPTHAAMQDVCSRLEAKDRVRQFDRTCRLAVERDDLEFHIRPPCLPAQLRPALLRPCRRRSRADGTCRVWGRLLAAFS